ncbi:MAG TPA: ribosome silencing factor [Dehalococcoidia bacterium]|nr:ribosome silencing factor [Dehalococcoidia bacterium]
MNLEAIEVARKAIEAASNKKAENIVLLDTRKICSFADYFVICTADSDRLVEAIIDDLSDELRDLGVTGRRKEGTPESGWVLLDIGAVIIHVFSPEQREYYRLDELWSEAIPVIRIQ